MPRIRLTKSVIDCLPALSKDTIYWDAGLPGFGVKVTPHSRKVFLVLYRLAGVGSRLRKYTIGPCGKITLPMALTQAQKIFAARLDGRDPAEEKKQSRRRMVVDRIDDLVESFIQEQVSQTETKIGYRTCSVVMWFPIGVARVSTKSRREMSATLLV